MNRLILVAWVAVIAIAWGGSAQACPILQVGAPGVAGEGYYADYQGTLISPTEKDTAITSGNTVLVAGIRGDDVVKLGGAVTGGDNYSHFLHNDSFNIVDGAVLVVSVADGAIASGLTVNGENAFYQNKDNSYFPNQHAPVQAGFSDFLFFNIDNFANNMNIPNFATESPSSKKGEIKSLTIAGMGSLQWIHFDVIALETVIEDDHDESHPEKHGDGGRNLGNGTHCHTTVVTHNVDYDVDLQNNPGSKDLTWKPGAPPPNVPEPGTIILLGAGLFGLGLVRRRRQS